MKLCKYSTVYSLQMIETGQLATNLTNHGSSCELHLIRANEFFSLAM